MKPNFNGVRLAIDFHGVIADLAQALIIRSGGPPPYVEDITVWQHPLFDGAWETCKDPTLYEYMFPIRDAVQAMRGLDRSGYDLTIATNQPPEAFEYTANWLAAYDIPFDKLILLKDKSRVAAHILVDDNTQNCIGFADTTGPACIFGQPWNRSNKSADTAYPLTRRVGWNNTVEQLRTWSWVDGRVPFIASKAPANAHSR